MTTTSTSPSTKPDPRILPSVIPSIYEVERRLRSYGLSERDIIVLIQRRTRPKQSVTAIKATLKALREIEAVILKEGRSQH